MGIPVLDAQHKRLFELLGEVMRSSAPGAAGASTEALAEVKAYADQHLEQEELLLRVRGYPEYAEHKAEHDAYREKAAVLQSQAGRRDFNVRLVNFITEWWRFHILVTDQRYAKFFRAKEGRPSAPLDAA